MAAVTKFEDLIAWQEARKLVRMVYKTHHEQAKKTQAIIGGLKKSILKISGVPINQWQPKT